MPAHRRWWPIRPFFRGRPGSTGNHRAEAERLTDKRVQMHKDEEAETARHIDEQTTERDS